MTEPASSLVLSTIDSGPSTVTSSPTVVIPAASHAAGRKPSMKAVGES